MDATTSNLRSTRLLAKRTPLGHSIAAAPIAQTKFPQRRWTHCGRKHTQGFVRFHPHQRTLEEAIPLWSANTALQATTEVRRPPRQSPTWMQPSFQYNPHAYSTLAQSIAPAIRSWAKTKAGAGSSTPSLGHDCNAVRCQAKVVLRIAHQKGTGDSWQCSSWPTATRWKKSFWTSDCHVEILWMGVQEVNFRAAVPKANPRRKGLLALPEHFQNAPFP